MNRSITRVYRRPIRINIPKRSIPATFDDNGSGKSPTNTLPPSSGGNGNILKTANEILINKPAWAISTSVVKNG